MDFIAQIFFLFDTDRGKDTCILYISVDLLILALRHGMTSYVGRQKGTMIGKEKSKEAYSLKSVESIFIY